MTHQLTPMYFKIPTDLKEVLRARAAKEQTTLTHVLISCIKSGLTHRLEEGTIEDAKIKALLEGARIHEQ